jgi:hypothetical protein
MVSVLVLQDRHEQWSVYKQRYRCAARNLRQGGELLHLYACVAQSARIMYPWLCQQSGGRSSSYCSALEAAAQDGTLIHSSMAQRLREGHLKAASCHDDR